MSEISGEVSEIIPINKQQQTKGREPSYHHNLLRYKIKILLPYKIIGYSIILQSICFRFHVTITYQEPKNDNHKSESQNFDQVERNKLSPNHKR